MCSIGKLLQNFKTPHASQRSLSPHTNSTFDLINRFEEKKRSLFEDTIPRLSTKAVYTVSLRRRFNTNAQAKRHKLNVSNLRRLTSSNKDINNSLHVACLHDYRYLNKYISSRIVNCFEQIELWHWPQISSTKYLYHKYRYSNGSISYIRNKNIDQLIIHPSKLELLKTFLQTCHKN